MNQMHDNYFLNDSNLATYFTHSVRDRIEMDIFNGDVQEKHQSKFRIFSLDRFFSDSYGE